METEILREIFKEIARLLNIYWWIMVGMAILLVCYGFMLFKQQRLNDRQERLNRRMIHCLGITNKPKKR